MTTRLFLVLVILSALAASPTHAAQQLSLGMQNTAIDGSPSPGVTVTILASHTLGERDQGGMSFDWIPLQPGTDTAGVLTDTPSPGPFNAPQLLYVEEGQVVVEHNGNQQAYSAGEHFVMPAEAQYNIRNESGGCASLLRLVVTPLFGGGFGSTVSGPRLSLQECGTPSSLITTTDDVMVPGSTMMAFIAEIVLDPEAFTFDTPPGLAAHTHPGLTAVVVESGELVIESGDDRAMTHFLSPGSAVLIGEGEVHEEYNLQSEPVVLTMAGVIPVGQQLIIPQGDEVSAPPPPDSAPGTGVDGNTYTSPNVGFSVSWDESVWSVRDDLGYSEPGYDYLHLEAPTGLLGITGIESYMNGDASACLESEVTYQSDPATGTSQWEVAVDANGDERTGTTENSSWGIYNSSYVDPTNPGADPLPLMTYIGCVSLGDNDAVVIFIAKAHPDDFREHLRDTENVVDSLELP